MTPLISRPWLHWEPSQPPSPPPRSRRRPLLVLAFLAVTTALAAQVWVTRPVPEFVQDPTTTLRALAFNQGRFVAIVNNRLHHSVDGIVWIPGPHSNPSFRDLRVANGLFYLAQDDRVLTSPNGIYWQDLFILPERTAPEQPTPQNDLWTSDGRSALVVRNRAQQTQQSTYYQAELFRTSDLQTWTAAAALPATGPNLSVNVYSMVGANGRCVISYVVSDITGDVGPSTSITACSRDNGATWIRVDLPGENRPVRLLYGNGWFLAMTETGNLYRSNDGIRFTRILHDLPVGSDPNIRFGGGLFITRSTGETNILYGSVDGTVWKNLGTLPFPRVSALSGVAYGSGQFMAVGLAYLNVHQPLQPFLMTSQQPAPPVVRHDPTSVRIAKSRRLRLSLSLEETAQAVTYRWMRDGVVLVGETAPTLTINPVSMNDTGSYRALITNAKGTVASAEAQVTVIDAALGSRLVNLSVNAINGSAGQPINVGFVVQGEAVKPVIVRGIGPTLTHFGVTDALPDPQLTLLRGGVVRAFNDNWGLFDGSDLGGFPLPVGSRDAVIPTNLPAFPHSVVVDSPDHGVGRVLIEVYDNNLEDGETRLTNLSARAHVPAGGTLIVGFVIEGEHDLPVVLRAIGPTLADYGIDAPLSNPQLTLFRQDGAPIASNRYWSDDDGHDLGAFPLPVGSSDAVIKKSLAPGIYTAHITSAIPADGSGTALLEIYDAL